MLMYFAILFPISLFSGMNWRMVATLITFTRQDVSAMKEILEVEKVIQ